MTITEMWTRTTELEARADEKFKGAVSTCRALDRRLQTKDWLLATDTAIFWRDVRNGYRQAADALHALFLIEQGGDWS